MSTIAYRDVDARTLNLMDDVWASTELSPTIRRWLLPGEVLVEVFDTVGGGLYFIDNGANALPDGHSIRLRYLDAKNRMHVLFEVSDLPDDSGEWQQKAIEPVIATINRRQRRMARWRNNRQR